LLPFAFMGIGLSLTADNLRPTAGTAALARTGAFAGIERRSLGGRGASGPCTDFSRDGTLERADSLEECEFVEPGLPPADFRR